MDESKIPSHLRAKFADWTWMQWWHYPEIATTWKLEHTTGEVLFLKLVLAGRYPGLVAESERLRWASKYLTVPKVVAVDVENEVEWMITEVMHGTSAVDDELRADPASLVPLLGKGLRLFHDLPVEDCPFDFRAETAVEHVRSRVKAGLVTPATDFHPEFAQLTAEEALAQLESNMPEDEDLVVCHGDYCFPNVFIEKGEVVGFLDLGELGVADRWWDLAVGAWSTTWNVGPGWEDLFYRTYGVEPDAKKIAFYRLLYDMVS